MSSLNQNQTFNKEGFSCLVRNCLAVLALRPETEDRRPKFPATVKRLRNYEVAGKAFVLPSPVFDLFRKRLNSYFSSKKKFIVHPLNYYQKS